MTRKEQKERTREHLLQTAYQEFAKRGIIATKTLDIAQAANVSHGTLFVHFPTRDLLLIQVIEEFGLNLGKRLQQLAAKKQGIKSTLEGHIAVIQEYEPFYAQLVIEGPLLPPLARYKIFLIQSGIAAYLEKAAKLDIEKGMIRKLPLHLMLNTWLGLLHHYLVNRDLFAPGQSVLATHKSDLIHHFMNCISKHSEEIK
jgi:AcrR family transcriptional regulator